jgi:transcriptional regulator with XRE-family HTH domain
MQVGAMAYCKQCNNEYEMATSSLLRTRLAAGLTQQQAAARLHVSQPYYSQMETGARRMPPSLALAAVKKLRLSPLSLPLPPLSSAVTPADTDDLAGALGALGYPGFAHLARPKALVNPSELVVKALVHEDLDVRLVEALPWLLAAFPDLDWEWLVGQCRVLNLQNRLGYLVELAAALSPRVAEAPPLRRALQELNRSRLAHEGTLCRESMREAEKRWVRKHRPASAVHWNLLTTLTVDQLTNAA